MNAIVLPYIGQPLKRREDFKFLTGKGRYVDDIKLPGMLYMAIARSPHAHAIIRNVELSSAKAAPGVRLVLAGRDLDGKIGPIVPNWILPGTRVPFRPVLAIDRVQGKFEQSEAFQRLSKKDITSEFEVFQRLLKKDNVGITGSRDCREGSWSILVGSNCG